MSIQVEAGICLYSQSEDMSIKLEPGCFPTARMRNYLYSKSDGMSLQLEKGFV